MEGQTDRQTDIQTQKQYDINYLIHEHKKYGRNVHISLYLSFFFKFFARLYTYTNKVKLTKQNISLCEQKFGVKYNAEENNSSCMLWITCFSFFLLIFFFFFFFHLQFVFLEWSVIVLCSIKRTRRKYRAWGREWGRVLETNNYSVGLPSRCMWKWFSHLHTPWWEHNHRLKVKSEF